MDGDTTDEEPTMKDDKTPAREAPGVNASTSPKPMTADMAKDAPNMVRIDNFGFYVPPTPCPKLPPWPG